MADLNFILNVFNKCFSILSSYTTDSNASDKLNTGYLLFCALYILFSGNDVSCNLSNGANEKYVSGQCWNNAKYFVNDDDSCIDEVKQYKGKNFEHTIAQYSHALLCTLAIYLMIPKLIYYYYENEIIKNLLKLKCNDTLRTTFFNLRKNWYFQFYFFKYVLYQLVNISVQISIFFILNTLYDDDFISLPRNLPKICMYPYTILCNVPIVNTGGIPQDTLFSCYSDRNFLNDRIMTGTYFLLCASISTQIFILFRFLVNVTFNRLEIFKNVPKFHYVHMFLQNINLNQFLLLHFLKLQMPENDFNVLLLHLANEHQNVINC